MTYQLLALDLDGTLLRRDGSIHANDHAAIARLRAAGVPITIVTGRLYSGSIAAAHLAGIVGPIACVDGSHIVDFTSGEELVHRTIVGGHALRVRAILDRHRAASFLFAQDSIVHDASGVAFAPYVHTWSTNIRVVERVTDHPFWEHERGVLAVVAVGPEGDIDRATREIESELAGEAFIVSFKVQRFAGTSALIVRAAGPTKGTAIEFLASHYGCSPADVVAVGDWLNDVPMFQTAGRSFAMGQAPEHVKTAATDRLLSDVTTGGGVAEAIERAFGV